MIFIYIKQKYGSGLNHVYHPDPETCSTGALGQQL